MVMDLVNGTGDDTVTTEVTSDLAVVGVAVGTVSTATAADTSAIEYPSAASALAHALAGALHAADLLRAGDVDRVTIVIGGADAPALRAALHDLTAPACDRAPVPAGERVSERAPAR